MNKAFNFLYILIKYLNGDYQYEKYLEHYKKSHKITCELSKKDFLKLKRNQKWHDINKCC
jgi:uncharacterized short protein YbdD (DUF466 family)